MEEVQKEIIQALMSLLLRVWQEVCNLCLDYLKKSPTNPYKKVISLFIRHEYQKDAGNLPYTHLMMKVDW